MRVPFSSGRSAERGARSAERGAPHASRFTLRAPRFTRLPVVLDARVVCGTGGGPDKTILNSPRFLERMGYRMICACMHPPGDAGFEALRQKAQRWRAPLVSIVDHGPWDFFILPQYLRLCRRERVAIWHGHDYKSNLVGLILQRFWPMRLVTTVHGWVRETRRTPLYYWVDRLCLPHYERVICVSTDLYEESLACGISPERRLLVENAVDTREFQRHSSIARAKEKLGLPSNRFLIGGIGRLSPEKGFEFLIRAVDRLLKRGCDVQLFLFGDGDEENSLRALVCELGQTERIRMLGYRPDLRDLYEAFDVVASSSLREGLPNVLLEAMAMEVPVVATRIAGIPRLIEHNVNGLLVDAKNEAQLAEALKRLYGAKDLRARFAAAGLYTIRSRYSFEARMDKIRALYDDLLGRDRDRGDSG